MFYLKPRCDSYVRIVESLARVSACERRLPGVLCLSLGCCLAKGRRARCENGGLRPPRAPKSGRRWKIPAGEMVFTCFTSDFLLAEADVWRREAWEMIRLRRDLHFMFFTKRIDRLSECLPGDWGAGYEHVTIGCTVENQRMADYRLPIFQKLPIRHKIIVCAPLIGPIDLAPYLGPEIEQVSVGGESGPEARVCDYAWVLSLRDQCAEHDVSFCFHQTGARLLKDGRLYRIRRQFQHMQARKAGIDFKAGG